MRKGLRLRRFVGYSLEYWFANLGRASGPVRRETTGELDGARS